MITKLDNNEDIDNYVKLESLISSNEEKIRNNIDIISEVIIYEKTIKEGEEKGVGKEEERVGKEEERVGEGVAVGKVGKVGVAVEKVGVAGEEKGVGEGEGKRKGRRKKDGDDKEGKLRNLFKQNEIIISQMTKLKNLKRILQNIKDIDMHNQSILLEQYYNEYKILIKTSDPEKINEFIENTKDVQFNKNIFDLFDEKNNFISENKTTFKKLNIRNIQNINIDNIDNKILELSRSLNDITGEINKIIN